MKPGRRFRRRIWPDGRPDEDGAEEAASEDEPEAYRYLERCWDLEQAEEDGENNGDEAPQSVSGEPQSK